MARLNVLEITEKLISFPTVSQDGNLALIEWIATYLQSHEIDSHIFHDPERPEKAAIFAHVGPKVEGGIVLSGHTDVVPIEGQDWSTDPWELTLRGDKYYGRGSCDMKGFDALAIWAMIEARYAQVQRPLQLALSYDEEIGCTGAPKMIRAMQDILPKASMVIVGEPTMMKPVNAHKGGYAYATHVQGFEVHSSLQYRGVSAIHEAARLIEWANEQNAANAAKEPDALAALFDPPYTTWHVGQISGGTADNITAKDCHFTMSYRAVPSDDPIALNQMYFDRVAQLREEMQAVQAQADIVLTPKFLVPALKPEADGEAETLVRSMTGDNGTHVVSYGTEAGQFQEAGYSVVVCGPGSIEQAHQPDEYILKSQLEAGEKFMRDLVDMMVARRC